MLQSGLIIVLFLAYFVLHSWLASLQMKSWIAGRWPEFMPFYRMTFNLLAVILALPLVYVMFSFPGKVLWQWEGISFYLVNGLALAAAVGFFISLDHYDLSVFWGTRQIREKNSSVIDQEPFHLSFFHRFVRHPWYFFLLIIIWTRDMTTTQVTAYLLVTLYLFLGSRLEERKLVAYHGEVYRRYRTKVAGLLPLPWKILSATEAAELLNNSHQQQGNG